MASPLGYRYAERRKVIFFTDSRGEYVQRIIERDYKCKCGVEVLMYKGATIGTLVENAIYYAKDRPYDILLIAGGICDITDYDRATKEVSFRWRSSDSITSHIITEMEKGDKQFNERTFNSKMAFCNIAGANLTAALKKDSPCQQEMLNDSIYKINEYIFHKNIDKNMYTPDLATPVHRRIQGKNRTFLDHLALDGIHLSNELKEKWLKKMLKTRDKYG